VSLSFLREEQEPIDWRAFIDSGPNEVMFQTDLEGRVVWISTDVQQMLGLEPGSIVGTDLVARVHPDDRERILAVRQRVMAGDAPSSVSVRILATDGSYRNLQATARQITSSAGEPHGMVVTWRDVNYRVAVIRAFATLAEGSRVLLRATSEQDLLQSMCRTATRVGGYAFAWYGVPVDDEEKSVRILTVAGEDMGYTRTLRTSWGDGPLGQGPTGLAIKTRETQVRNNLSEDPHYAPWFQQASRRGINCSISLPVLVHGQVHGALMVYSSDVGSFDDRAQELLEALAADLGYGLARWRDADALQQSQAALEHEVAFDSLTGLAKQRLALERINDILETREAEGWALLCFGVDGMTSINQAYTYAAGDAVLKEVANRLVAIAGAHDRVGRIAGDEFVVLLRDLITTTDAAEAAQRIMQAVHGPIEYDGVTLDVSGCVGIAMSSGTDAEALLRDATAAMRGASRQGPGRWAFLDENVAARSRLALDVQSRLRDAIANGRIVAWFMPVVSLQSDALCGYEALVRWVLDDGTVMPPDTFLHIAERSSLILDIDRIVLRQAFDALVRIDPSLDVAVNVSAASLQSAAFEGLVQEGLERTGIEPSRLHLEVTETTLLNVTPEICDAMRRIAALGVIWWLDDFGTGYSSISHLRDLPIQGLKLDQSFTAGISTHDSHTARLTRGLAGLADGLNLRTVAEGVETAEQAALLQGQGWELAQGWHFGKPAPLP
jgi:diguanylate cyclase (GGDEF)-like protein/PAS domain S-box-containing protein